MMSCSPLIFLLLVTGGICHKYFSPFDFLNYGGATVREDPAIVISATPNLLNQSGDWVTVTWSGVSKPSSDDWIGVYAPPTDGNSVDPTMQAPVKFQYCRYSIDHLGSGQGSFKFRLVNLRAPYVFAFLRGGFDSPSLAAVSNVVKFVSNNEPLQGHLALTNDPTTLTLTWVTKDVHEPKVKWWENLTSYIRIESAVTSVTYSEQDMCGPPATTVGYIDPGLIHSVNLTGLTPGRSYNYQFGDDSDNTGTYQWSQVFSFRVPPLPSSNATTSIIAFGDMGQAQLDNSRQPLYAPQTPALNNTRLIEKELNERDLVLHIGDISYAIGYAGVWDEFFDLIQPIATKVPYMVCGGNHERDYPKSGSYFEGTDSGGECGIPYEKRFSMPGPSPSQHWYSFSIGSLHIVLMSTELDFTIGSVQYKWLNDHLSSVNRSITPWLIFAGHRPMYVDSTNYEKDTGDIPVAVLLQKYIEPLLMQYKVDLALWGHHHSYQRTCPVYQNKCTDGAPVHAVIGMAGQTLSTNIHHVAPEWIEFVDVEHYGYTRITATPDFLTLQYLSGGSILDKVTLKHSK